jgi:hypothetical protein
VNAFDVGQAAVAAIFDALGVPRRAPLNRLHSSPSILNRYSPTRSLVTEMGSRRRGSVRSFVNGASAAKPVFISFTRSPLRWLAARVVNR